MKNISRGYTVYIYIHIHTHAHTYKHTDETTPKINFGTNYKGMSVDLMYETQTDSLMIEKIQFLEKCGSFLLSQCIFTK